MSKLTKYVETALRSTEELDLERNLFTKKEKGVYDRMGLGELSGTPGTATVDTYTGLAVFAIGCALLWKTGEYLLRNYTGDYSKVGRNDGVQEPPHG